MDPDAKHTQLASELDALEVTLEIERKTARHLSRTGLMLGLAIVTIAVTFVLVNYSTIQSEWTEDNLAESLRTQIEQLRPVAIHEATALGENLLPVYADESQRQFTALRPEIDRALTVQRDLIFADMHADAGERLDATEARLNTKIEGLITASYPELDSPEAKAEFVRSFSEVSEKAFAESIEEMQMLYSVDVNRLRDAIANVKLPESDESTASLQTKFVHLWLMILDKELMKS